MNGRNDNHWHAIEERRHREHMEIRAAAIRGDSTIEQDEEARRRVRAANYHREQLRLLNAVIDAMDQKREAVTT